MVKLLETPMSLTERARFWCARLAGVAALASLLVLVSCSSGEDIAAITYVCGNSAPAQASACGAGDPNLPPEPTLPTDVCQTLVADKSTPDESKLDTDRIQAALSACAGRAVKLVADGKNNAFLTAHLTVAGTTL